MAARLARLVTLACALVALLILSLHVMAPMDSAAEPSAHAAHGSMDRDGPSGDPEGASACAIHCLVVGVLPPAAAGLALAARPTLAPEPRPLATGLVPQPQGPPPKPVASA